MPPGQILEALMIIGLFFQGPQTMVEHGQQEYQFRTIIDI